MSPLPLCDSSKPGHALASGSLSASTDHRSSGTPVREESQRILPHWRYSSGHVQGSRGPPVLVGCADVGSGKGCTTTTRSQQKCFTHIHSSSQPSCLYYYYPHFTEGETETESNLSKVTQRVSGRACTEPRLWGSRVCF